MPQIHTTLKPSIKREAQILEAATAVFAELGYRRTRVQDIADRAHVGKGTVYRIFPTKEALFLAAVRHSVESLIEAVDRETEGIEDLLEQLKAAIKAYLRFLTPSRTSWSSSSKKGWNSATSLSLPISSTRTQGAKDGFP